MNYSILFLLMLLGVGCKSASEQLKPITPPIPPVKVAAKRQVMAPLSVFHVEHDSK